MAGQSGFLQQPHTTPFSLDCPWVSFCCLGEDSSHCGLGDLGDLSSATHVKAQDPTFCGTAVLPFTCELQVDTALSA